MNPKVRKELAYNFKAQKSYVDSHYQPSNIGMYK